MSTEDFASFTQHRDEFDRVASTAGQLIATGAGALVAVGALYFPVGGDPTYLALAALGGATIAGCGYYFFQGFRWTRGNCPRCGGELHVQLFGDAKRAFFSSRSKGDDSYYICHPCRKYFLIQGRTQG